MDDGILPELRAATSAAHQHLEDAVQIEQQVRDVAGYRGLLEKFWGWYKPLEEQITRLHGWPYAGYDPNARMKLPWLERDLRALGLDEEEIAALPRCKHVPETLTLGAGFGCAYVIEGATLGGRHISAMLKDSPVPAEARTFFSSYGAQVGERWKEFLGALQTFALVEKKDKEHILTAASDSFMSLNKWLSLKPMPV